MTNWKYIHFALMRQGKSHRKTSKLLADFAVDFLVRFFTFEYDFVAR